MKARIYANNISYIISVSVGTGCYRHLRISGNQTLNDLAEAILGAFDFDNDHLYSFFMDDKWWSDANEYHSPFDEEPPFANQIKLTKLRLTKGQTFKFLFDYGDEWRFQCKVLQVLDEGTKETMIVRKKGESPEQYPSYEDVFDENDFEDNDLEEPERQIVMHTNEQRIPQITQAVNPYSVTDLNETADIPDEMFEAAFQFRSDKLWKKLYDTELFAVQLSNGEIGYCSVMGTLGECVAIAVYIGDTGLWSLYQIMENDFENSFAAVLSQNCLQLELTNQDEIPQPISNAAKAYADAHDIKFRGQKSYPTFLKFQSYLIPGHIESQEDFRYLTEAVRAAHEVAKKLKTVSKIQLGLDADLNVLPLLTPDRNGFSWSLLKKPETVTFPYPKPQLADDMAEKLRELPQKGTWESRVFLLTETVIEEETDSQAFLPLLLTAGIPAKLKNETTGEGYYPDAAGQMLADFAEWMLKTGSRPQKIVTKGKRSLAFLSDFCDKCGITLTEKESLPKIDKMLAAFQQKHETADGNTIAQFAEMITMLEQMSDAELREMPPQMIVMLSELFGEGILSDKLEKRLKKLL